jgi:hypothetical protein
MERWEHMEISVGSDEIAKLPALVQDLGCYGWELAGLAGARIPADAALVAILKRPMVLPHDPHDRTEGWKPDPCGRWDVRWWDGQTWTFYVGRRGDSDNHTGRDAPTMLPVFKQPNWTVVE